MIRVIQKGLHTTVQDLGRWGHQRSGVPVSGAMDWFSASLANILVGNPVNTPLLEMTVIGPTLEFTTPTHFAITGGIFTSLLSNRSIPVNQCIKASAGSILQISAASHGMRGYIAFAGGLDIPLDMGSASTYVKAALGGVDGRALQNGDGLVTRPKAVSANMKVRFVDDEFLPDYSNSPQIRVIACKEPKYFTEESYEILTQNTYVVAAESDRMGCRLQGPVVPYAKGCDGNIISDGIAPGSIQIAGGHPIILLADRQTTGGYAKIASVITADLPLVAQLKHGDTLTFSLVSVEKAQEAYLSLRSSLKKLNQILNP